MNLANVTTAARLFVGLGGVITLAIAGPGIASLSVSLFAVSVALDGLDGYLARSTNCASTLGRSFDAAADYAVLWTHLLALVEFRQISVWLVAAAIVRELFLQGFWDYADMIGVSIKKFPFWHTRYLFQVAAVIVGELNLSTGFSEIVRASTFPAWLPNGLMATSLVIGYCTCAATFWVNREVIRRAR